MLLGVVERIGLLQILPKQGDFLTLRIIHELRQSLSFTEEETAEFGLETDEVAQTGSAQDAGSGDPDRSEGAEHCRGDSEEAGQRGAAH